MNPYFYSIIGWIGMILIILTYFLLSNKRLVPKSINYNLLNAIGGIGVLVSSIYAKLWLAIVFSIFWIVIAVYSIYKIEKNRPGYKELT